MTQLTYYPSRTDPEPEAAERGARQVLHGYTLRDLDQMSRAAAIADRTMAGAIQDRCDTAWSAIAEALAAADERPDRQELIRIGWQAIYREVRTAWRERGRPDEAWNSDTYQERPRFALYWNEHRVTRSHENRIVEGIAARQVLAPLSPTYRDAVVALAATDDYQKAADLLGISLVAFKGRIATARRRLLALWHEGETPRPYRQDRRAHRVELAAACSNGHEWAPENTHIRHRVLRGTRHTSRVCKACERERNAARSKAKGAAA